MPTQIINGRVSTPQGWLNEGSVLIRDGRILEVTDCDPALIGTRLIDAKGMYMVPSFVCMYAHGGSRHGFNERTEEALRGIVQAHPRHDATSFYPTISSSPFSKLHQTAHACERLMEKPSSPIFGLHIEGPYPSRRMAGEQFTGQVKGTDEQEYREFVENTRCIRRWDASPRLLGALEFTGYLRKRGILATISHTEAEYNDICAAYKVGLTHAARFYNAMPGFRKRREYRYKGTVEDVYLTSGTAVELIADGIHLSSIILKLVYKLKGVEHACFVTDALPCAITEGKETSDPHYIIEGGICKLADRPSLAGSIITMDVLACIMTQARVPLENTLWVTSEIPARTMGVYDRKGSLQKDKNADILIVDKKLNVRAVWQAGKLVQEDFLNYK